MSNYATKFVAANRCFFSRIALYITTQRLVLLKKRINIFADITNF